MKKILLFTLLLAATSAIAKDIKTAVLTLQPQMHCAGCENKVKNNLRFVKGIKTIEASAAKQCVVVTYDAEKSDDLATDCYLLWSNNANYCFIRLPV